MDIRQTVADSLAATARSKQGARLAIRLTSQARSAMRDKAQQLVAEKTASGRSFDSDEVFNDDGIVVAEWFDDMNRLRCIVVTPHDDLRAYVFSSNRPSGMAQSIHRFGHTPLQHLEEYFGPLMEPEHDQANT